jgi:hypothetical protein
MGNVLSFLEKIILTMLIVITQYTKNVDHNIDLTLNTSK